MTKTKPVFRRTDRIYGTEAVSRVEVDGETVGFIAKSRSAIQREGIKPEWVWFRTENDAYLHHPADTYTGTRPQAAEHFIRRLTETETT
jgi:hypothetical protein